MLYANMVHKVQSKYIHTLRHDLTVTLEIENSIRKNIVLTSCQDKVNIISIYKEAYNSILIYNPEKLYYPNYIENLK